MTQLIHSSGVLAFAALACTAGAGCSSDDLFHLSSVAHGLSIREQAGTRVEGDEGRVTQATVVGDLDGDGYDDAIIRDDRFGIDGELYPRGAVRVLYGGPALGTSVHLGELPSLIGDEPWGSGGGQRSITGVGDVDGDGLADLLIGGTTLGACSSSRADLPEDAWTLPEDAKHGRAYLVYGSRTRLIGDTPLGQAGAEIRDPLACSDFADSVFALGDLDHDGLADFGVIDFDVTPAGSDVFLGLGAVDVFYGRAERLTGRHEPGEAEAVLHSPPDAMGFGSSTVAAGDVDGDGFDDILLADFPYGGFSNTPAQGIGHAYLVRGGAARLAGVLDASTASATTITGDVGGFELAGLGDLDGDGADDFAVVAAGAEHRVDRTAYHVFYGRAGGLPARLSTTDADARLLAAEGAWGMTPLVAGDTDGDGRRDLIMGDANLGDGRGGVFVLLGDGARLAGAVDLGALGTTYQGGTVHVPCPHTMDWDGQESCTSQEYVGAWVGAGDLDGDGRTDVLACAPTTDGFSSVYLLASKAP